MFPDVTQVDSEVIGSSDRELRVTRPGVSRQQPGQIGALMPQTAQLAHGRSRAARPSEVQGSIQIQAAAFQRYR